jgi:PEP-CTERM motif
MNFKSLIISATAAACLATSAQAAITVFSGQDDGAAVGGPFTNSAAAEAAFLAAAGGAGTVATETFEGQALGYYSPIPIVGGSISYVAPDFGPGFSGVSDGSLGNVFGFNVTSGGSKWFGFPSFVPSGAATVSFTGPTKSFGFYMTGVQTQFTASIVVSLLDGSTSVFDLPLNVNGGVSYFGIVDTQAFTAVSIVNTSQPGFADAWGIDDISYNTSLVPEPASWAMLVMGFGLVGATMRRRKVAVAA